MTSPKKPAAQPEKPPAKGSGRAPKQAEPKASSKPKDGLAAEAAKRLAKMTPEEQAAELFKAMLASGGKKTR